MKTIPWRKIYRLAGFHYNRKYDTWFKKGYSIPWINKKMSAKEKLEELKLAMLPECEWCNGSGVDSEGISMGAYYDCIDCQGTGKDWSK